jgi:hypothetical protein
MKWLHFFLVDDKLRQLSDPPPISIEEPGMSYLADPGPETALGPLQQAACTYRTRPGQGRKC